MFAKNKSYFIYSISINLSHKPHPHKHKHSNIWEHYKDNTKCFPHRKWEWIQIENRFFIIIRIQYIQKKCKKKENWKLYMHGKFMKIQLFALKQKQRTIDRLSFHMVVHEIFNFFFRPHTVKIFPSHWFLIATI